MDKKRRNIFIHQYIVPEYRVPIFRKLIDKFENLYLIYGNPRDNSSLKNGDIDDHDRIIKVRNYYLPGNFSSCISGFYNLFIRLKPGIVITQYSPGNLNIYILIILKFFFDFKLIGWTHGWNRERIYRNGKSLSEKLRLILMKCTDGLILYDSETKVQLSRFINSEKIFVANNTLNTDELLELKSGFDLTGKEKIKNELGFKSKYNLVYSGRLIPEKNLAELMKIFKLLRLKIRDVSLHMIGGGPLELNLKEIVKNEKVENINFYGSNYDNQFTGKIIYCCDLMIIPRWVGLSIIHSFSFDCPLVTFEEKIQPPEITYLIDGETGYNLSNYSYERMVEVIIEYLKNEELQLKFKNNIRKTVQTRANVNQMINGVSEAIEYFSKQSEQKIN